MVFQKLQKSLAVAVAASLVTTSVPAMDYSQVLAASKQTTKDTGTEDVSSDDEGVFKVTMDDTGYITADNDYAANENTPFSWDNVNMYFVMTDRFENGDKSNDHAYERSTREKGADNYENRVGTFHGGDLAGMTKKIEEGYFDELGTNAIWITAPYEQIHGAMCSTGFKHYAYHGYYALDFTNVDGNMGTAEDMEKFVDTAHSHGIRVVFDIVMNHAGYADAYTANEYGFGKLASNWEDIYYNWDESKYQWYNDYEGEAASKGSQGMMVANGDWTTNWWGSSWIRALGNRLNGYEGIEDSGPDDTMCSKGLPDFKTETTNDPGLPGILKTKWNKEGNYAEKVAMTNSSMEKAGLSPSVTGYICSWLSQWVRDYGIDGFRCDTAKHVKVSEWKKLKDACKGALKEWRENNPDKPGAQWKDDFWMTGEHWNHGVGKDEYYTSGAFDSMINFTYKGNESKTGSGLESVFSSYASQINSDPSFNVLSYISSHDTSLGARSASAGTALLLTPGGVQTYYGDESGRQAGGGDGDQPTRSHMNWSSTNTSILSNWQKVGRFRRNHIAVGAGQHKKLADSPYTFSRTYTGKATVGSETKTDYEDKVVVSLPGSAGTYDVTVSGVFEDGATVVDEYSGTEYTVSGGKVSGVECDNNGVILLAVPTVTTEKAKISASVGSKEYNDDTLAVKFSTKNIKDASYQVNDCDAVSFSETAEVTIGEDTAYGEETTVTVKGTSTIEADNGAEVTQTYTYKRGAEPKVSTTGANFKVRVKKSDFADGAPNIYIYYGDPAVEPAGAWPGASMTEEGDYYVYSSDEELTSANVILVKGATANTEGNWRAEAKGVSGNVDYDLKTDKFGTFEEASGTPGKVTVNYQDGAGNILKTIYRVGVAGKEYKVYAPATLSAKVDGKTYELAEGQKTSETGTFAEEEATVTFTYAEKGQPVVTPTPTVEPTAVVTPSAIPTVEPTEVPTEAPTEAPTEVPTEVPTQVPTEAPTAVPTEEPTLPPVNIEATPTVEPTVAPTEVVTPSAVVVPTETPAPVAFGVKMSTKPASKQVAGKAVTIKAVPQGATGTCTYKYLVENSAGNKVFTKGYSSAKTCTWKPTKAGTYVISVYIKDKETGMVESAEQSFKVTSAALVLKKLSATNLGKLNVKLTATTTGGTGTVKYKFVYKYKGKTRVLKNYSKTKSIKKKFKKAGTYKFTVYVKDSTGKVKKKTITFKVKKKK